MDAKSRANFINSVALGNDVACPNCGANNSADSNLCVSCGAEINVSQKNTSSSSAFKSIKETDSSVKTEIYTESGNIFAQGLPEWSPEPPHVMVRRR